MGTRDTMSHNSRWLRIQAGSPCPLLVCISCHHAHGQRPPHADIVSNALQSPVVWLVKRGGGRKGMIKRRRGREGWANRERKRVSLLLIPWRWSTGFSYPMRSPSILNTLSFSYLTFFVSSILPLRVSNPVLHFRYLVLQFQHLLH